MLCLAAAMRFRRSEGSFSLALVIEKGYLRARLAVLGLTHEPSSNGECQHGSLQRSQDRFRKDQ
jgi:hypothetical protein